MFSAGVGKLSAWAVSMTKKAIWGALVLLLMISIGFSISTIRSLLKPLHAVIGFAGKVAKGELNDRLSIDSRDETKLLADAFNQMVESLQQMMYQMENYLNNAPIPVTAMDRQFNILFMNQKAASVSKTTVEAGKGKKCYDLFENEHCHTAECRVKQAMEGKRVYSGQTVLLGADNLPIHYFGAPLMDHSGNVVGGVEYITDVSELKEIEKALQNANDFLQGQIADATRNITTATTEILATTSEQAASASEQAAAVNQTATTVEQARQTTRQSSERAQQVARVAEESSKEAEEGFRAVERTLEGEQRGSNGDRGGGQTR